MPRSKGPRKKRNQSGSGGSLSGLRGGFKGILGKGNPNKKESLTSKIITYLLIAAAAALLVYRFLR